MTTAITGGIGSGKSYVCRLLEARGIDIFYCDAVAKDIIAHDPAVRAELTALITGDPATVPSASSEVPTVLTKERLGAYLRTSPDHAARVNAIVHPRVARAFEQSGLEWMECAILFESGFDRLVDRVVVVTCPEDERIRRITRRDHCDAATAHRWLALQMTDEERLARAAYHIINDGITPLEPQLNALLLSL